MGLLYLNNFHKARLKIETSWWNPVLLAALKKPDLIKIILMQILL